MFHKLITTTITAAVLAGSMSVATSVSAQADKSNPNISISKGKLKGKCKRSGGDWTVEKNGTYRCVVSNDDSMTVVECKNKKCEGNIFETTRIIIHRQHMNTGNTGIMRNRFSRRSRTN
jgi:hypothetical protein